MKPKKRLALTLGDFAGIGPEIALKAIQDKEAASLADFVLYGNEKALHRVSLASGVPLPPDLRFVSAEASPETWPVGVPLCIDFPFPEAETFKTGKVQTCCGRMAGEFIRSAVRDIQSGYCDVLVTAPINKEAMRAAGSKFPGHTEMLASLTGNAEPCMAFFSPKLFVSLVTIHEAIADVSRLITKEKLERIVRLTREACKRRLCGREPALGILALNPHAGEHGLFGNEEADTIEPVMAKLAAEGFNLVGPLVPDTAFSWLFSGKSAPLDGYVAMYHDQGLIPFKAVAFDTGVNVTLGLPIVRTSPDHGTAFDKAWQGTASASSMTCAIKLALELSS